ncbi:MAG: pectate lyase [Prevotella sp.]|nr:pectate lyase [Prevotella sp.]
MFKTNRLLQAFLLIALSFLASNAIAQTTETLAFPGAEGFGRYVSGGRGGTVYHVTTLEDNTSEGSFRYAVKKSGTRTIVFDVSGTIHLTSELKLSNGNVTIAGQTAPGDGICIADYPFTLAANNVIIRFMRFRMGDVYGQEADGLGGMDKKNIIVDHCSVSWSIDECLSVYGNENQTVQWCIVSQSLVNSAHSSGAHGYGGNWGGAGATYHHNLLADHNSRTPRLGPRPSTQTSEQMDLRNNVIYNWAGNGCYGGEGMNVNIVNNYYKVGPGTETTSTTKQRRIASIGVRTSSYTNHDTDSLNSWDAMWHVWGKFYVDGNVNSKFSDVTNDNWTYGIYNQISNDSDVDYTYTQETKDTMKVDTPIPFESVTTHTAEVAYEKVLDYAGCSLHRDWLDEVIVSDTRNGEATYTGSKVNIPGLIDSQDDLKPEDAGDDWSPWPELASEEAPLDTDGDGIPDDWEDANGLDKNNASDGSTIGDDGYSNLENYMNSIVADIMEKEVEGGVMLSGTDIFSASIKEISASSQNNSKIYNLQGIQVKSPLSKGIYISNGKKFVVK